MSTSTAPATAERHLTRWMLDDMLRVSRWLWPAAVVVTTAIVVSVSLVKPIVTSAWENGGHWPRWFLFAMAIAIVTTYLPNGVAHGLTRRAVLRAAGVTGALSALTWALFMALGHVVERRLYDAVGWSYDLQSPHLFAGGYDVLPMLAEYGLVFAVYMAVGALAGGVYYRYGGWAGSVALPLTLSPLVAAEGLLSTGWVGSLLEEAFGLGRAATPVVLVGTLAVLLLTAAAAWFVLRDIPLRPKS